ncbi:uncharacterized protein TNIN_177631 [Trichonephila inaurata madagascariensis]|uniref:Uncharacterized protein n=1 Tax=Trichonephila inaurata madagascariensis TaxID=2747483 RepID=A0A8X6X898_9ARAC|nr:uncharacterized protein TNIN_177631 [Trichonephila inaurata madagascariensis]
MLFLASNSNRSRVMKRDILSIQTDIGMVFPHLKSETVVKIKVRKILRPILFLFVLCGIDTRGPNKKWVRVLSSTYNIVFLALFSEKLYCFTLNSRHWAPLLTLFVYMIYLIMWWYIQLRMKDISALANALNSLISEIDYSTYKRLLKVSNVMRLSVIFLVCFDAVLRSMQEVIFKRKYNICPYKCLYSDMGNNVIIPIVLSRLGYTYVTSAIAYSFAAYYIFYLFMFSVSLRERQRSKIALWELYRNILNIFKRIEGTLSFLVTLLFLHIFNTFFKTMLLIVYGGNSLNFNSQYIHCYDLVTNIALVLTVLFSAECVQQKADNLRVSLFASATELNEQVKILEDRKRLKLTGWGIFNLRKSLLLSIGAWFFTYTAILIQMQ